MMRVLVIGLAFLMAWTAQAGQYSLILSGAGGTEYYQSKFPEWGARLRNVLVDDLGHKAENVRVLTETGEAPSGVDAKKISLDAIREEVEGLCSETSEPDELFIYLIGHGSHQKTEAKFNIEGPDMRAEQLDEWLQDCSAGVVVVIDATSTSAPFINTLSGPDRIIAAATKNVEERNATEFIEHFIAGLADGSADMNRDERISVWEACRQASILTEAWYMSEGLIPTEHAILDDNGDGFGTRLQIDPEEEVAEDAEPDAAGVDGEFASQVYLSEYRYAALADRELVTAYKDLLDEIEALKLQKAEMEEGQYRSKLEELLIEAARTNREIRRQARERQASASEEGAGDTD